MTAAVRVIALGAVLMYLAAAAAYAIATAGRRRLSSPSGRRFGEEGFDGSARHPNRSSNRLPVGVEWLPRDREGQAKAAMAAAGMTNLSGGVSE